MPSSNYPTSLDTTSTQVTPGSTTDLDASGFEHDQVHGAASTALIALETKSVLVLRLLLQRQRTLCLRILVQVQQRGLLR